MSSRTIAVISLVLVMCVWGSSFVVTKQSLDSVPPLLFAVLRFAVASALLLVVVWVQRTPDQARLPWRTIILVGLFGVTLYYIGYNLALYYTTATQTALIQSAIPAATAMLAFVMLGERLSGRRVFGIVVSIAGTLLVILVAAPAETARDPLLGALLTLGSVIAWALYTIFAKRIAHADPLRVTAYSSVIGTALLLPGALWELRDQTFPVIPSSGWASVLYLGAVSSAGGFLLYNRALAHLDAHVVATFLNIMPVVGVALAIVALGEAVNVWQLTGGALVLLGVWLSAAP